MLVGRAEIAAPRAQECEPWLPDARLRPSRRPGERGRGARALVPLRPWLVTATIAALDVAYVVTPPLPEAARLLSITFWPGQLPTAANPRIGHNFRTTTAPRGTAAAWTGGSPLWDQASAEDDIYPVYDLSINPIGYDIERPGERIIVRITNGTASNADPALLIHVGAWRA